MSRKFDRQKRIDRAAMGILANSVKPKPWWFPKFIWVAMLQLIFR
jgi:hypothetical protein